MEAVIAGKYRVTKKIGEGSFGEIYAGKLFIQQLIYLPYK